MVAADTALEHPFWKFSLTVYSQEGVPAELLALQDAFDLDVNIILFCLWLGCETGVELTEEQLDSIYARSTPWHLDTVVPLRGVRRYLKMGTAAQSVAQRAAELRNQVKRLELLSEQIEQAILYDWYADARVTGATGSPDTAEVNLTLFMARKVKGWDIGRTRTSFAVTLAAAGSMLLPKE